MTETRKDVVHTPATALELALAAVRSIAEIPREGFAILWAQYCGETGRGQHCYNFNIGNVKHVAGDGFDYVELHGVWEGMTREGFDRAKAGAFGAYVSLDDSEGHRTAVAPRLAVRFDPPHPATWFRAYDSLTHAVDEHARFLEARFPLAWEAVLIGDLGLFVHQLRARGYFTANEISYLTALRPAYDEALGRSDFEHAIALRKDEIAEEATDPGVRVVYAMPELEVEETVSPQSTAPSGNESEK